MVERLVFKRHLEIKICPETVQIITGTEMQALMRHSEVKCFLSEWQARAELSPWSPWYTPFLSH